jgi:hypothetical protein
MQISGRVIIIGAFALALSMSGGAWWYHYTQVRQAAAFWGSPGGRLLVRGPEITFFELGDSESVPPAVEKIAGRKVLASRDLSGKPGLVHLRHALYQDASFVWEGRKREPVDASGDWAYAIRFAEGEQAMTVLFPRSFERVGKVDGSNVEVLPAPRIAQSVRRYLTDIGAIGGEEAAKSRAEAR